MTGSKRATNRASSKKRGPGQPPKGGVEVKLGLPPWIVDQLQAMATYSKISRAEATRDVLRAGLMALSMAGICPGGTFDPPKAMAKAKERGEAV